MPAHYKFVKSPHTGKENAERHLYPRFVSNTMSKTEELLETAGLLSGLPQAQVCAAFQLIEDLIVLELKSGRSIKLEGIGTFSLSLESPSITHEDEIRGESIKFRDVTFRSSLSLRRRLGTMRFYRKEITVHETCYTKEQRRERLIEYLETHSSFTRIDYMELNRCSKMTALNDLNRYIKEKLISRPEKGPQSIYNKTEIL